jgi:hypothetical protein
VNRFRTIALTAVTGFVLVACGPAASSSSGEPGKSEAAASQAQASSGDGVQPSFTAGAVSDLEDLIPDKVGDLTVTKQSVQTAEFLTAPGSDPGAVAFVEELGISASDISIATGSASNADFSKFLFCFVIRAQGVDSGRLVSAFQTATAASDSSPIQWSSATIGGKSVQTGGDDLGQNYIYAKSDVLFWVASTDATLAEQFISQLP